MRKTKQDESNVAEKVIYGQKALGDFLEELATESPPLPAGGCAVALAGALSAALEQFVTQLTIKKGKNPDSTPRLSETFSRLKDLQNQCVELMDRDVEAYERVMEALNWQTTARGEEARREAALGEAKMAALGPPMELVECGLEMLRYSHLLIVEGYQVALADAGVAAEMAHACLWGALWIAGANLQEIPNRSFVEQQRRRLETLQTEADHLYGQAREELRKRL